MNQHLTPFGIVGAGGGKKKSGGATEQPNSLHSKQIARIVDLLSEGPIVGPVNGAKSIYFDGVPIISPDGTSNFTNYSIVGAGGWPDQDVLKGFAQQQAETGVGAQVKKPTPITRTIINGDVDRARITVSVPALQIVNTSSGDIRGTSVVFDVFLQSNGGGYQLVTRHEISGKTNTRYQRALSFPLTGSPPWNIRVTRVTDDSTTTNLQNDLYWDSYTEIIDQKVNYTLSSVIGVTVDSEQFQSVPKRTYEIKGLIINVPSNYDPETRVYTGVWDGTFKAAWTNNPAWIFYDLVTNSRYGLGRFISQTEVNKWALYKIGQWCDVNVSDGKGGVEPRFVCNVVINTLQEAYDLLNTMAATFRGSAYWAGGEMVATADMPSDPVALYTNANVIDGTFNYHGSDLRSRHNMAVVAWNDPDNLGENRLSIVEGDIDSIARLGIQKVDLAAVGCTSEGQAIRTGRWQLYTDTYEGESVDFVAGLDTAWARPGEIVKVADINVGGQRRGGRVIASTTISITTDAPIPMQAGVQYAVSVMLAGGIVATSQYISNIDADVTVIPLSPPLASAPLLDSIFVITSTDLDATLWRVVTTRERDGDKYEMTCIRHFPGKWDAVENNIPLAIPDISNIGIIDPITNLNVTDYLVALSTISVGVRMLISWTSSAPQFEVAIRPKNGNWMRAVISQTAYDIEALESVYDVWITPMNLLGRRGATTKITYEVIGRSAQPADVTNFRINIVNGVAMFQWAPATDIDVIIGGTFEIRYSPRTSGVTWTSSNTQLQAIPGTATSVELPYRAGTYLIKARDILGLQSKNPAMITATQSDQATTTFVRICESPTWPGTKSNVQVQMPQEWLIITDSGTGPGIYTFQQKIDMGGTFPVRLYVDMLAFPYYEDDIFIDSRTDPVDTWQSWDSSQDDGLGSVTIQVSQTNDDPASGSAVWSDWTQFIGSDYTGRGFRFRAWLDAPDGQNVAIEQLCIIADVSAKMDYGSDIPWPAATTIMHISYAFNFVYEPAISIAVQEGVPGDTFKITNKTQGGFDLQILKSNGTPVGANRTFDWTAQGY